MMDLYETIGIDKNASQDEVKKAYKIKAGKLHPDRPGGNTEAFKVLQKAYDVLSDVERRTKYDQTGETGATMSLGHLAKQHLAEVFSHIIQQDMKGDITDLAKRSIEAGTNKAKQDLVIFKRKLDALNKRLGRVVAKKGANIYEGIIQRQIRAVENNTEQVNTIVEISDAMIELLADYEDTAPDGRQEPMRFYSTPGGIGSNLKDPWNTP